MTSSVALVFWNQDEAFTKAGTTFHVVNGEPDPASLYYSAGMSIPDFFKTQGVSIQTFMELFPGYLVPDTRTEDRILQLAPELTAFVFPTLSQATGLLTWDSRLKWARVPSDPESLKRMATLIGMPIFVYTFYRRRDSVPQFLFRVEP